MRESPALDVMALLEQKGARRHATTTRTCRALERARLARRPSTLTSVPLTRDTLAAADCVVIVTDHRAFDYDLIARHAQLVVDTRNAVKTAYPNVFKLGAPAPDPLDP